MKLKQDPLWFPLGVQFKFSDEHLLHFHMGVPLPPGVSKYLTEGEGVKE